MSGSKGRRFRGEARPPELTPVGCQVDHHVPYPQGPSSSVNCGLLCSRHHTLKTAGYEHVELDEASGWARYRTAWGQILQACGHPYLPDWEDEPYDVLRQRYPDRDSPPQDEPHESSEPDDADEHARGRAPDPPPGPEPRVGDAPPPDVPDDDPRPF